MLLKFFFDESFSEVEIEKQFYF